MFYYVSNNAAFRETHYVHQRLQSGAKIQQYSYVCKFNFDNRAIH